MEENKNLGEIVIFNTDSGDVKVQIDAINETIWMTQKGMSELFDVSVSTISRHIKNIFEDGELEEKVVVAKNAITLSMELLTGKLKRRK